jgi:catechol 2,3-dioxygenase-like lactoylglutathione lyase family enzyme
MKITALTLYTNKHAEQKDFYSKTLGFAVLSEDVNEFTIQVGDSKLTFRHSDEDFKYHYCFLIPSNLLNEGAEWLKQRLDPIKIEDDRIIQPLESWNASSVYFYDGAGNLAEFIVRYDLENEDSGLFDVSKILCVNEIGMPSGNIQELNSQLEREIHSPFWKGNCERFGTNGSQDGLFLLVNNELKKNWFPTDVPTQNSPFEAVVEVDGECYEVEFLCDGSVLCSVAVGSCGL